MSVGYPQPPSIALLVASGNTRLFGEWLERSLPNIAGHSNTNVVLVPWGNQQTELARMTPAQLSICSPTEDTSLEENRNTALSYLRGSPPELVAFVDDDAFVGPNWVEAMRRASVTRPSTSAFASIVKFEGLDEVQSQGHAFARAAPHDRGFKGLSLHRPVLCPCGNSAVVRWSAIERIWEFDDQAWDPLFDQWQTCFDFGLKLILTGSVSEVVDDALVEHRGYASWSQLERDKKARQSVVGQLRSRYLLYKKFLSREMEDAACRELNVKIETKWRCRGYTGFESIKGSEVDALAAEAKKEAVLRAAKLRGLVWQDKLAARDDRWDLLDLSPP